MRKFCSSLMALLSARSSVLSGSSRTFGKHFPCHSSSSSSPSSYSLSTLKWGDGAVSMVQGASRGIGLEFSLELKKLGALGSVPSVRNLKNFTKLEVRQLLENHDKGHVVATCRNPDQAVSLKELKSKFRERLNILKLDTTIETTIETTAKSVTERYGYLNLLVNTSGILSIPDVLTPETSLSKVQRSSLLMTYEVNAVGPTLVVKHMWPLLKLGGGDGTEDKTSVVANLSARVGSIGDNGLGGWHSYRSSKAALNQLTKTISVEFRRRKDPIICILLHPGTVNTDLSTPFQRTVPSGKLFTKEFSVEKLLGIIKGVKISDNGKFFAWDGQEIPW